MIQKHVSPARSLIVAASLAGLFATASLQAQQGYSGPAAPVSSVKQLIDAGRDDQRAVLRGRIVSRDGRKHYTFDDGTAQIRVEIKDKHFPLGQTISDKTEVELFGELERKSWERVEFEVDMLRVL